MCNEKMHVIEVASFQSSFLVDVDTNEPQRFSVLILFLLFISVFLILI